MQPSRFPGPLRAYFPLPNFGTDLRTRDLATRGYGGADIQQDLRVVGSPVRQEAPRPRRKLIKCLGNLTRCDCVRPPLGERIHERVY